MRARCAQRPCRGDAIRRVLMAERMAMRAECAPADTSDTTGRTMNSPKLAAPVLAPGPRPLTSACRPQPSAFWSPTTSARCGSCWRSSCGARDTRCARRERADGAGRAEARAAGPAHLRHQDARHERRRGAARGEGGRRGDAGHHDDGLCQHRDGGRSDAARRVRLPDQAVRRRRAEAEGAREARERGSCGRRTCC